MSEVRRVAGGPLVRLHRQRRQAVRYVEAGWPVLPGAWWDRTRYRCGVAECRASGLHAAGHHDASPIESVSAGTGAQWADRPCTLLLATGSAVDVLELPALASAAVESVREMAVPVARLPTGRWLLFAATVDGAMDSRQPVDRRRGGPLLHGPGALVPVPPSQLPHGRVRWRNRRELDVTQLVPMAELMDQVVPLIPNTVESTDPADRQQAARPRRGRLGEAVTRRAATDN